MPKRDGQDDNSLMLELDGHDIPMELDCGGESNELIKSSNEGIGEVFFGC